MKKVILPGILAGILMAIIGMAIGYLFNIPFPSLMLEYENINVFRAFDDPLMSLFFLYPLVLGIVLAWVWDKSKSLFKCKYFKRALAFGAVYFLVATIPGMLITYSSFQVSLLIVGTWTLNGLLNGIIAGLVFGKLNK